MRCKKVGRSPFQAVAAAGVAAMLAVIVNAAFADDLKAVRDRGVLRHLGVPYANFVVEGTDGLDVQLMKAFAQHLGVKYELVPTTWENAIGDLTGKKALVSGDSIEVVGEVPIRGDVIANGFTVLPARRKLVDFSVPTFPTQIWVIARSDSPLHPIRPSGSIDEDIAAVRSLLKGRRLLGKANTCVDPALYDLDDTGVRIMIFEGGLEGLVPLVMKGDADLSLLDMPDALIALDKWPGRIKVIGPLSRLQEMACAFSKDSPVLREHFNAFFKQMVENGSYHKLVQKFYPAFSSYYPDHFWGNMTGTSAD